MVVHERPGVDNTAAFAYAITEALQKTGLILIIIEDNGLVDPAHHNVMKGAGSIETGLTWHERTLRLYRIAVKS